MALEPDYALFVWIRPTLRSRFVRSLGWKVEERSELRKATADGWLKSLLFSRVGFLVRTGWWESIALQLRCCWWNLAQRRLADGAKMDCAVGFSGMPFCTLSVDAPEMLFQCRRRPLCWAVRCIIKCCTISCDASSPRRLPKALLIYLVDVAINYAESRHKLTLRNENLARRANFNFAFGCGFGPVFVEHSLASHIWLEHRRNVMIADYQRLYDC